MSLLGTVLVARAGDAEALGVFAVTLAVYFAGTGMVRAAVGDPIIIAGGKNPARRAAWLPFWVGIVVAWPAGLVLYVQGVPVAAVVLVAVPALLLQSALRLLAYAKSGSQRAAVSNVAWLIGMLLAAAVGWPLSTAATAAAVWSFGGVCAAVVAVVACHAAPVGPRSAFAASRAIGRGLSGPLVLESALVTASSTLLVPASLATVSLTSAGQFRAATTVMGLVSVAVAAWDLFTFPRIATAPAVEAQSEAKRAAVMGLLIVTALVVLTLAVQSPVQRLLFGGSVTAPIGMLVAVGLTLMLGPVAGSAQSLLKRHKEAQRLLTTRMASLSPGVALCVLGVLGEAPAFIVVAPVVMALAFSTVAWVRVRFVRPMVTRAT